jgi:hypothetical protein
MRLLVGKTARVRISQLSTIFFFSSFCFLVFGSSRRSGFGRVPKVRRGCSEDKKSVERWAFSETEALEKVDSTRDFAKMRTETEASLGAGARLSRVTVTVPMAAVDGQSPLTSRTTQWKD